MSDDPLYREIILEHWQNPQNYGVIKSPDLDIRGNNPLCGDNIHITASLKGGKITGIAFEAEGCAISKASASLFTEFAKGKALRELTNLTAEDALSLLEVDITPARIKCALLPLSTLKDVKIS